MKKLVLSLVLVIAVLVFIVSCSDGVDDGSRTDVTLTFMKEGSEFGTFTVPANAIRYLGNLDGRYMTSPSDVKFKTDKDSYTLLTSTTDLLYYLTSTEGGTARINILTPMPTEDTTLYMNSLDK